MFCANCGKKIEKEGKFCPNCGYQLETNVKTNKNSKFIILLVVGLLIFGIGYKSYSDSSKETNENTSWKYSYQELEQKRQDNLETSKVIMVVGFLFIAGSVFYKIVKKD